ncbi:MAG: hypothetical protein IIU11_04970 [Bacteroidales bacterium]|nr:hypothetical protein [Bacteroidales bacterium]
MKKIFTFFVTLLIAFSVKAQEVTSFEEKSQMPISTSVDMGCSFSNFSNTEYLGARTKFQPLKRWDFSLGLGMAFSNFKAPVYSSESGTANYQNLRALTNYYTASASYRASQKLSIYSSVVYFKNDMLGNNSNKKSPYFNRDAYMATFGATYQITPSFSVGFEVRNSQNVDPYGFYYGGY